MKNKKRKRDEVNGEVDTESLNNFKKIRTTLDEKDVQIANLYEQLNEAKAQVHYVHNYTAAEIESWRRIYFQSQKEKTALEAEIQKQKGFIVQLNSELHKYQDQINIIGKEITRLQDLTNKQASELDRNYRTEMYSRELIVGLEKRLEESRTELQQLQKEYAAKSQRLVQIEKSLSNILKPSINETTPVNQSQSLTTQRVQTQVRSNRRLTIQTQTPRPLNDWNYEMPNPFDSLERRPAHFPS